MLEEEITGCCKKLRLSRNIADMAQTTTGGITSGIPVQIIISGNEKP
jgi:hypothetical protein